MATALPLKNKKCITNRFQLLIFEHSAITLRSKILSSALWQILLERITHEVDFGIGHGGIERQGEFVVADVLAFGGGADLRFVGGKALDGGIVDGGLNTILFHEVDELRTVDVLGKEDGHDVVGRCAAIVVAEGHGEKIGQPVEAAKVVRHPGSARGIGFGEPRKLHKAERCSHFVDAIVEAWLEHVVGGGTAFHAVKARHGHAM